MDRARTAHNLSHVDRYNFLRLPPHMWRTTFFAAPLGRSVATRRTHRKFQRHFLSETASWRCMIVNVPRVVYCTYREIDSPPPPPPPNVASMRTKELSTTKISHGFSRYYTSHALGALFETIELDNGTMGQYDHFQIITQTNTSFFLYSCFFRIV